MTDRRERQLEIDFDRATKLRTLDRVILPAPPAGSYTSRAAMMSVLRAIDNFSGNGEAWRIKIDTLAEHMERSRSSVSRALSALVALGLVERVRTGRANVYGICWEALRMLRDDYRPAASGSGGGQQQEELPDRNAPDEGQSTSAIAGSDGAQCAGRERKMRHLIAQDAPSDSASCAIVYTAPCTDPPTASAPREAAAAGGWAEMAEALRARGVAVADRCVATCRERGLTPAWLAGVIDHFDARRGPPAAWQPGAIVHRIRAAAAGQSPADPDAWPPPSPEWQAAARRESIERARRREESRREAQRRQRQADRERGQDRLAALERCHGADLDAMPADQVAELLEARSPPAARLFRRQGGRPTGLARLMALESLAERTADDAGHETADCADFAEARNRQPTTDNRHLITEN